MATADSVAAKLRGLLDLANAATGKTDTTLTAAVNALIAGYGKGTTEDYSAYVRHITFVDYDGVTVLGKVTVALNNDCPEPVSSGLMDQPEREGTVQYSYTFSGWSASPGGTANASLLTSVSEDKTVYAAYTAKVNKYVVTYYDDDGVTVLKAQSVSYGSTPSYTPEKEGWAFEGWVPELSAVTGNASYTAVWRQLYGIDALTWAEIAEVADSGTAPETFWIGASKAMRLTYSDGTTEDTEAVIIGFDHDDLASGSGKAHITFQIKALGRTRAMNDTEKTWNGTASDAAGGWQICDLRSDLNTNYFAALPDEVSSLVKEAAKLSNYPGGSDFVTTNDKLWLLSTEELFGSTEQAKEHTFTSTYYSSWGTGTQYEYYRSKGIADAFDEMFAVTTAKDRAWTRKTVDTSATSTVFESVSHVTSSAVYRLSSNNARTAAGHISFCFCI